MYLEDTITGTVTYLRVSNRWQQGLRQSIWKEGMFVWALVSTNLYYTVINK